MAKSNGTATAVKLSPLGDRVVVQPASREETTKSGLVIPDTAKEKPQRGTVVAVGKGRKDDDGDRIPMDVEVGDTVIVHPFITCGLCLACRRGDDMHCANGAFPGINRDSGFAEFLHTSARSVVKLDPSLHPTQIAALADAGLTAIHAVKKAIPVLGPGTRAVVIGAGGLGHIGIQCLRAMTPAEIIVVDPSEEALALDIARVMNLELRELVKAGATDVQIDEPYYSGFPEDLPWAIKAINAMVEGVNAKITLHVCYGNRYGKPSFEGSYKFLFPAILGAKINTVSMEFARRGEDDLQLFKEFNVPFQVAIGVIDVKTNEVESPAFVADRIRRGLDVIAPERLIITPDCGLVRLPRDVAFSKLSAMAEGTRAVRKELGR